MLKVKKSLKIFFTALIVAFILVMSILPSFAASGGSVGDNFPNIPLYLELHFNNGNREFMNITDRFYLSNYVGSSTTNIDGYPNVTIRDINIGTYPNYIINNKGIRTEGYGFNVTGFTITAPTFYLTVNSNHNSFNEVVPSITIPSYSSATLTLSYDLFLGGTVKYDTITKSVSSTFGSETVIEIVSLDDINSVVNDFEFNSVRIDNLKLTTNNYTLSQVSSGDTDELSGTWILNEIIYPYISSSLDKFYFNFTSNNQFFIGMTFGDGIYLSYNDLISGNETSIQVYDNYTEQWVNEEYRTIMISDNSIWDDVAGVDADGNVIIDAGLVLKDWLITYSEKSSQGVSGSNDIIKYRYATQTLPHITDSLNAYFVEFGGHSGTFEEGFQAGKKVGLKEGEQIGYDRATTEQSPNVTAWLATMASGFLAFELIPGISLLGILSIIIALSLAIVVLKFFAGG